MIEQKISIERMEEAINVFGSFDENVRLIESELHVTLTNRDGELKIAGEAEDVELAGRALKALLALSAKGEPIHEQNVRYVIGLARSGQEDKAAELETALDGAIDDYSAQMEQALAGSGGTGSANYAVVTLSAGQVLEMDIGCEVMLRVGSASCDSPSSPGLIDSTGGTTLNDGGSLAVNHLYMATIEGRSVTADSDTVKVLVRGGYTIR